MPGTGEPLLRLSPEERKEVRAALPREDLSPRARERLEMVKAAGLGHDLDEAVAWSGRKPRTVRRWLGAFAGGGIGALADAPRSGRPVVADAAYYLAALEEALPTSPRKLGLGFEVRTSERLSAYLARTKGVRVAPGAGCGCCSGRYASPAAAPGIRPRTLGTPRRWPPARPNFGRPKKSSRGAGALRATPPGREASGERPLPV
ncbi:MAG TPA: helix-turn-helix domain-containing protein [Rubrobacteraceae bacterium]|jgi:transposase|nr:helix-turn-helix domain-containing protein [Rubrobacteraceae bacterium]